MEVGMTYHTPTLELCLERSSRDVSLGGQPVFRRRVIKMDNETVFKVSSLGPSTSSLPPSLPLFGYRSPCCCWVLTINRLVQGKRVQPMILYGQLLHFSTDICTYPSGQMGTSIYDIPHPAADKCGPSEPLQPGCKTSSGAYF
jgi:hypothetical protein